MRCKLVVYLILTVLLAEGAYAAPPELSSEEPLVLDAATQSLVARGEAQFIHDDFRVEADEIRYFRAENRAEAEGNVRVTRPGFRITAERMIYNVETRQFEATSFRAGYPPIFAEGVRMSGDLNEVTLEDVTLYLGEPMPASPTIRAEQVILRPGDRVLAMNAQPGVGKIGLFRIPEVSRPFDAQEWRFEAEAGYRGNLGAFLRTQTLIPLNDSLYGGAALDVYTGRGVLIGPAAKYYFEGENTESRTELQSGWIYDGGDRGFDYFARPIPEHRYFGQLRHKQVTNERLYITGDLNLLSDSDVLRDFRPGSFDSNHYPDSFLEGSYLWDDVILTALARFETGGDYASTQRLPEIRLDLLSSPLPVGGIYHTGFISAARIRQSSWTFEPYDIAVDPLLFPDEKAHFTSDSITAFYGWKRPVGITNWLTLTPRAGAGYAWYEDTLDADMPAPHGALPGPLSDTEILVGELGADLKASFHADWNYENKTWGIDGLRHIVQPVAYWRYYNSDRRAGETMTPYPYRRGSPEVAMSQLDLREGYRLHEFYQTEPHLLRFGIENLLQTSNGDGTGRSLVELNLYQDYELDDADWQRTHIQTLLQPAAWLDLGAESAFNTDNMDLEWARLRIGIRSADNWRLGLYADYYDLELGPEPFPYVKGFHNYAAELYYRLHKDWGALIRLGYDAERGEFDRQQLVLIQQLGSVWEIQYRITLNDDARREDSFGFSVSISLAEF